MDLENGAKEQLLREISDSKETLVVVTHIHSDPPASKKKRKEGTPERIPDMIAVYSMRDSSFCQQLPPIPGLPEGIPQGCQCVSLDGKIYLLGGGRNTSKVFAFDLAGERQWKECASMMERREAFGCGVMHGKIFVFGGTTAPFRTCFYRAVMESEVYDPKENVWSPIRPMITLRAEHSVEVVGEELVLHSGVIFDRDFLDTNEFLYPYSIQPANFLEIYHPGRDEWRVVMPFGMRVQEKGKREVSGRQMTTRFLLKEEGVFVARGKFHSLSHLGIHVHDAEKNTWTLLHSLSSLFAPVIGPIDGFARSYLKFPVSGLAGSRSAKVVDVLVVDDELLVMVSWYDSNTGKKGYCDVRSRGFGSADEEIEWHKLDFSFLCKDQYSKLCSIRF